MLPATTYYACSLYVCRTSTLRRLASRLFLSPRWQTYTQCHTRPNACTLENLLTATSNAVCVAKFWAAICLYHRYDKRRRVYLIISTNVSCFKIKFWRINNPVTHCDVNTSCLSKLQVTAVTISGSKQKKMSHFSKILWYWNWFIDRNSNSNRRKFIHSVFALFVKRYCLILLVAQVYKGWYLKRAKVTILEQYDWVMHSTHTYYLHIVHTCTIVFINYVLWKLFSAVFVVQLFPSWLLMSY